MADVELYTGFASAVSINFAALNDLDSVPTGPGWYAWFQIPGTWSPESFQLYRHSKVESSVSGIFNLTFEGKLNATGAEYQPTFDATDGNQSLDVLKSLFIAFAPPLYIGLSKNLHSRLKTHRRNLQDFLQQADSNKANAPVKNEIEADTDRESQYFGSRIGNALRTLKLSSDTLYVKCVLASDPGQLKKIEKTLNFALTPHYGRR